MEVLLDDEVFQPRFGEYGEGSKLHIFLYFCKGGYEQGKVDCTKVTLRA